MGRKLLGRSTYLIKDEYRTLLDGKRTRHGTWQHDFTCEGVSVLSRVLQLCSIGFDRLASIKKNTNHNITIQPIKVFFFCIRLVELQIDTGIRLAMISRELKQNYI